ncbi:hypothetical protein ACLB2K_065888 [Fragaria x ananassa]
MGPSVSFFFPVIEASVLFCHVSGERRKRTHVLEEHNQFGLSAKPNNVEIQVSEAKEGLEILKPFTDMGFRIMAIAPDYDYLFHNTPAEAWFLGLMKGNVRPRGVSIGQNLSNVLRFALLYKFGGIYLDIDVIVLKRLSKMKNVIGAQTIDLQTRNWSRLKNAVLVFDKNYPLLFMFIQEFALTFDSNKWGHNGPYLVSRGFQGSVEHQTMVLTLLW